MKLRKVFLLIIAMLLVMAAVIGCSSSNNNDEEITSLKKEIASLKKQNVDDADLLAECGNKLREMVEDKELLESQFDRGVIIGKAFIDDFPYNRKLDYRDRPAEGLVIELHRALIGAAEDSFLQATEADPEGNYYFWVPQGQYIIIPRLDTKGYPSWDSAENLLPGATNLVVGEGKTVIGPIWLIDPHPLPTGLG